MGNYDFSIMDVNENTLYFKFIRKGKDGVKVCSPGMLKKNEIGKCIHNPYKFDEKPSGVVVIPESVEIGGVSYVIKEIDNHAFYDCGEITRVVLPKTITKIGEYAFYGCGKLVAVNISNLVKTIGNCAFQKCESLKELFLPEGLELLGGKVCEDCKSLKVVKLPNLLRRIKWASFKGCMALEVINIPQALEVVDELAFVNCVALRGGEIPCSMFRVAAGAFEGCNIKFRSLSDKYVVKEDCLYRVDEQECELLYVPNDVEELELPSGVKGIKYGVFGGCRKLKRLRLPSTVELIDKCCFLGCSLLEEVDIPEDSSLKRIGMWAFSLCRRLKRITLPSGLEFIGGNAFEGCLADVENRSERFVIRDKGLYTADYKRLIYVLPDAVKFRVGDEVEKIDPCAFSGCENLRFLILSKSFDKIPRLKLAIRNVVGCIYTLNPMIVITCYDFGRLGGGNIPVKRINEYEAEKLMNVM